jgi:hypothetical protein
MQNKQRVSLQAVLALINQQDLSVERSSSQEARFYVVPRTNFTKGLSTVQQKWLLTSEELMARYEVQDDDADYDTVDVFSDGCPRDALCKWIHQINFCLKLGRTSRAQRTAALPDNIEGASRSVSSNDAHVVDAGLETPEKKRCLKKLISSTSSDEENKTLSEIVQKCSEAAAAGRIYSIDKTNSHT